MKRLNALKVIATGTKIAPWLEENDPKAMEQVMAAIETQTAEIDRSLIRQFALVALDDPKGISSDAYDILLQILKASKNEDICNEVDIAKGRVFLSDEDYADKELEKMKGD